MASSSATPVAEFSVTDTRPAHVFSDVDASVAKMERSLRVLYAPEVVCWRLRKSAPLRSFLLRVVTSVYFDAFLAFLVICNAIALGFYQPTQRGSDRNALIAWVSLAINCVFALEMLAKLVAFGMWGERGSYLTDRWNWLDAALVVLGFGALSPRVGQVSALRILRLLRWMYAASPGMRIVLLACFKAVPGLAGVLLLATMTYVVFALIGACCSECRGSREGDGRSPRRRPPL
jgi:hypothetical protein